MNKISSKTLKVLVAVLLVGLLAAGAAFLRVKSRPTRIQKRADQYFAAGEYDKARIEYMNLLKAVPGNATAIRQLGIIWFEQGAPLQALPFLSKSRELAPTDVIARTKLAQALVGIGDIANAHKEAVAILDVSPVHEEAISILADTSRTPEQIDETEKKLADFKQPNSATFHLALASLAARKRDQKTVEAEIQRAIEIDPKSSTAHIAMAAVHLGAQKTAEAEAEFKVASMLAPTRSSMRVRYAEFQATSGKVEEANALLREITTQASDYLPAWRGLAQIAFIEKKYDDALALLENVFGRDGGNIEGRMLQAQIWMAKGEHKKAVEGLERLSHAYSGVPAVMFQLGVAYLQDANPTQAAAALGKALDANPDYVEAALLLGQVNLRRGDAQSAADEMLDVLKRRPQLTQAQLQLADAYRALAKPDSAAEIHKAQIETAPNNWQFRFLLGITLQQAQKYDEARAAFEKALELAPGSFEIEYQLAGLDLRRKDFGAALERAQKELQKTPTSAMAQFLEGRVYGAQGDWPKAETAFLKTLDLDANFSPAYDGLVTGYVDAGQLPEAIAQLERRLAKTPDDGRALMTVGLLYEKMQDFSKARDAYEKLVSKNPNAVAALNNLACLYADHLKEMDKALEFARKAQALTVADPSLSASIADTLGWILYRRGEYNEAFPLLQDSARKAPNIVGIQYHFATASYTAGRSDMARQAFQQLAKVPENALSGIAAREEIQRRLALLGDGSGKSSELSIDELQTMLKSQPDDIYALLRLAEAFERQQAFPQAGTTCEQALKVNPRFLPAMLKLAELDSGPLNNLPKALELAKAARELDPTDSRTTRIVGAVAYRSGDFEWSYSLLHESARVAKTDAGILHDLAWAAYGLGKQREARETMQRAVAAKLDGNALEDARTFLAMTALAPNSQEVAAAEPEVRKILAADPKYVPALMVRAALETQRDDLKAATATYTEILGRYRDFAPAQKLLAALYAQDSENLAQAYALATKARATLPDDPELTQTLAQIGYRKKEFANVVELLEPIDRKTLSARSLFFLGMSYVSTKDKPHGRECLQQAIANGLAEPLLAEARRAAAELGPE